MAVPALQQNPSKDEVRSHPGELLQHPRAQLCCQLCLSHLLVGSTSQVLPWALGSLPATDWQFALGGDKNPGVVPSTSTGAGTELQSKSKASVPFARSVSCSQVLGTCIRPICGTVGCSPLRRAQALPVQDKSPQRGSRRRHGTMNWVARFPPACRSIACSPCKSEQRRVRPQGPRLSAQRGRQCHGRCLPGATTGLGSEHCLTVSCSRLSLYPPTPPCSSFIWKHLLAAPSVWQIEPTL